jgi:hypothetical protein
MKACLEQCFSLEGLQAQNEIPPNILIIPERTSNACYCPVVPAIELAKTLFDAAVLAAQTRAAFCFSYHVLFEH